MSVTLTSGWTTAGPGRTKHLLHPVPDESPDDVAAEPVERAQLHVDRPATGGAELEWPTTGSPHHEPRPPHARTRTSWR